MNAKNAGKYPIEADFVNERVKFSFPNSSGNFLSPIWSINDTKNDVKLTQRALNCYKPLKHAKNKKKSTFGDIFGKNTPFFGPESCVFEIALVSLVGVRTYKNIPRPTQNPTLAGMDPLPRLMGLNFYFLQNSFQWRNKGDIF